MQWEIAPANLPCFSCNAARERIRNTCYRRVIVIGQLLAASSRKRTSKNTLNSAKRRGGRGGKTEEKALASFQKAQRNSPMELWLWKSGQNYGNLKVQVFQIPRDVPQPGYPYNFHLSPLPLSWYVIGWYIMEYTRADITESAFIKSPISSSRILGWCASRCTYGWRRGEGGTCERGKFLESSLVSKGFLAFLDAGFSRKRIERLIARVDRNSCNDKSN